MLRLLRIPDKIKHVNIDLCNEKNRNLNSFKFLYLCTILYLWSICLGRISNIIFNMTSTYIVHRL